ncbi:MAG TPA: TPM domain-containing protein [Thermoanaerobaculia bacterium]|nr:TPM domain-containing protein [Thermoanaerobaculia bacterium]
MIALLLALAVSAQALDVPPPPTAFVTDQAGILNGSDAQALNEKLASFEQRSGAQFIIYIFPTLDDEALEDFTIRCAEKWKVGNKKYDNGLILFVFVKERKLRIEVGYGLEGSITDAFSSDVIRNYIAPHFQNNDYAGGLNAAADAIIAKIEHNEAPVPPAKRRASSGSPASGSAGALFSLIFVVFVIIMIASLFARSRPGCGGCFWPMLFLGGGSGRTFGGGGWGGGGWGGGGGGGFGGFSGGGGSFGGGGASGGW